ncbi:MAG: cysteine--tRNA ligase [Actinobacteria bacterium]|nr:cysteine--tRNA ligase [Actinomycetota bacterium]
MGLKLYNTLYRKKQDFIPLGSDKVRMYVCGPTVYNYISIGNTRPVIVFNMIRNYLEHIGYKVDFVQNITDIEDKIINKANEEGVDFSVITKRYIDAFKDDMKKLNLGKYPAMPLASEMIEEIISIIQKIIENGYGYIRGGNVYFDVAKFPKYGKLSGQKVDEMQGQDDGSFEKKSSIDFALWKSAKPGEPSWDSPWGKGRPGWHIECSAMSIKYLDYGLDIHGGGIDLIFPHHENEIAQSEAAFPQKGDFVKYWMHNGMIEVKDEKMSKSKGLKEDWILKNLLKKYSANIIKMYILSTHYRSPLEFSVSKLKEASKSLEKISNSLRNIRFLTDKEEVDSRLDLLRFNETVEKFDSQDAVAARIYGFIKSFKEDFKNSMDDDFNSAKAIGDIFDFVRNINSIIQSSGFSINEPVKESLNLAYSRVLETGKILGFNFEEEFRSGIKNGSKSSSKSLVLDDEEISRLIVERNLERKKKDFAKADEIRQKLASLGILLDDRKEGTVWKRER